MTRPRILLVDDEIAATSLLASTLRDVCDCDVANTVAVALARLAAGTYHAVVCDLVLDGDAAALHDALSSRGLPVLLLSGREPEELARVATARGWSYVAKPVSPSALRREIAALVGAADPEPTGQHRRGLVPLQEPVTPSQPPVPPQPSQAAPTAPVAVLVLDRLVDVVAIVVTAYLCAAGRVDGPLALAVVGGIAGVGGITRAASRSRGAGVGVAGAAVLALASALAPSTASASTQRSAVSPPAQIGAAVLALVIALALLACGPAREAVLTVTPGVPPASGCVAPAQRCDGDVPVVCSPSGRWWPALPRDPSGAQRRCLAGCAVEGGVAFCRPADGGAL